MIKCLGFGGAERLLVDTVATADRDGFDYEVAYVLDKEDTLVPEIAATGTPVHSLGATGNGDLRWLGRLRQLLVDGRFDIVHFHLPYAAALGRLVVDSVPKSARPLTMYTEHNLWHETARPVQWLNRATVAQDRALVVVSESAHQDLPRPLRARARVIVHGVDLSHSDALLARRPVVRTEVRAELGIPEGQLLALTVANLRAEKGYEVLLATARRAADNGTPVRFVAVGRGPLEPELHELHRQLDLGEQFTFLGPRDDVLRLMAGADLFVLSSHYEGLPVTLMEATTMGLAIVATAVGGVPEAIIDGESGLLVPAGDPAALEKAIARLAGDPGYRAELGRGAKDRSTRFDVTAATRQIEAIYRRLVGSGR